MKETVKMINTMLKGVTVLNALVHSFCFDLLMKRNEGNEPSDKKQDIDVSKFEEILKVGFDGTFPEKEEKVQGGRNKADEEKVRMILIMGLNSYSSAMFLALAFAKNENDRAKINQQVRLAQFIMGHLNDPLKWKDIADAIWG